jgi:YesN/AraC family two-component response regulator
MEPSRLSHLSNLLFASTVYISDSSHALILNQTGQDQQRSINEYIQSLKDADHVELYPVEKERELVSAITQGDRATAGRLLNEILGHIFFSTGGKIDVIQARVMELLVVLSRAAMYGGADVEQIFGLNLRYLREVEHQNTPEELAQWLSAILDRFTTLVFDLVDIKHKDVIYKAVDYMKRGYSGKLTLEETAAYVNLSPSYFSKVFKEELGCSFNTYLNELRIEKSKSILLAGSASIVEICDMVGFEDQSYFTKVFKKITGVTPGKYRERRGRIDLSKERG